MHELLKMRFFCLSSLNIPFPKWNFMSHCKKKRPSREVQSGNWGNGPLPHAQSTRMSLLDALSVVTLCRETRVSLKTRAVRRNLAAGRSWKQARCGRHAGLSEQRMGSQGATAGGIGAPPRGGSIPRGWVPYSLHDFWLQMSKQEKQSP